MNLPAPTVRDIVEAYDRLKNGQTTSYAVVSDAELVDLIPMLTSLIQVLDTNIVKTNDAVLRPYLQSQRDKVVNTLARLQVQMVRNQEFKEKRATA